MAGKTPSAIDSAALRQLGRALKQAREDRGYSLRDMGQLPGMTGSYTYISAVENVRENVSIIKAEDIANTLGYELHIYLKKRKTGFGDSNPHTVVTKLQMAQARQSGCELDADRAREYLTRLDQKLQGVSRASLAQLLREYPILTVLRDNLAVNKISRLSCEEVETLIQLIQ